MNIYLYFCGNLVKYMTFNYVVLERKLVNVIPSGVKESIYPCKLVD